MQLRSPTNHQNPFRLQARKRGALGGADGSPARKQQKKKAARKDRRRVSFAPDPELTMVHHFLKVCVRGVHWECSGT